MIKGNIIILISFFSFNAFAQSNEAPTELKILSNGKKLIEDFESEEIGSLPSRWFNQKAERKPSNYDAKLRETYNYEVREENGNKYLHFEGIRAKHLNFPLIKIKELNIHETPILSWDLRAFNIPEGGNEDSKNHNDVVASVYIAFDMGRVALFKKVPKTIRYTWSSTLPVGTELSKFFGNQKIVVVASGKDGLGSWKSFSRNIVQDYKRLFGDSPPKIPLALLILSDGDDTNKIVIADYDNFTLSSVSN